MPELQDQGPMENQVVRLRRDLRDRVTARAAEQDVPEAWLYRAYIEAGDRADTRREARMERGGRR